MRYLLDTNMVSDLVRNPQGRVAARIAQRWRGVGLHKYHRGRGTTLRSLQERLPRLLAQLLTVLDAPEILPFETPAEIIYGDLRARLEATGKPIDGNDRLIAAHAVSLAHTIVTDNEREFSRVDGLPFENWLRL